MKAPLIVIDSAIEPEKLKQVLLILEEFESDDLDSFHHKRKNGRSADYKKGYMSGYAIGRRSVEERHEG